VWHPTEATLAGSPVVGHNDNEGVVKFANALQSVYDATELVVCMRELGGKRLFLTRVQTPLVIL